MPGVGGGGRWAMFRCQKKGCWLGKNCRLTPNFLLWIDPFKIHYVEVDKTEGV